MPYTVKWLPKGQTAARTTGLVFATSSEAIDHACAVLAREVDEIWIEDELETRIDRSTIVEYCRGGRTLQRAATSAQVRERDTAAVWPVGAAALAALADYGLTDEDIGRYFRVPTGRVAALRQGFGIGEAGALPLKGGKALK